MTQSSRPDLRTCVQAAWNNRELLVEYDRLRGTNLALAGSRLDLQIDFSSGRLEAEAEAFVQFVRDCIWSQLDG
jgi:hypothetical protein